MHSRLKTERSDLDGTRSAYAITPIRNAIRTRDRTIRFVRSEEGIKKLAERSRDTSVKRRELYIHDLHRSGINSGHVVGRFSTNRTGYSSCKIEVRLYTVSVKQIAAASCSAKIASISIFREGVKTDYTRGRLICNLIWDSQPKRRTVDFGQFLQSRLQDHGGCVSLESCVKKQKQPDHGGSDRENGYETEEEIGGLRYRIPKDCWAGTYNDKTQAKEPHKYQMLGKETHD